MPARDVKLVAHRWDMHAIQALGSHDSALLARIFAELKVSEGAIDTRVRTFGCGAPAQFHSYGFFDKRSSLNSPNASAALLEHVVEGDTLLLIALRNCDAQSAVVLINAGAALETEANSVGETPMQRIFDVWAATKLEETQQQQSTDASSSSPSPSQAARSSASLDSREYFEALFALVREQINRFYDAKKAAIREELSDIYTRCAPERLAKLPQQLQDFEFREHVLLDSVRRKYLE